MTAGGSSGGGDSQERAAGWNRRYEDESTGWDLGVEAPPLGAWLRSNAPSSATRVLVPGAGRGHDARAWARWGAVVTAVDFAPSALAAARRLADVHGLEVDLVEADVTAMPADWTGRFDVIWEHTCLCALPPELREPYLDECVRVLAPGGTMHALLWAHGREGGPPWDLADGIVAPLFESRFVSREVRAVTDSVPERVGERWWTLRGSG